MEVLVLQATAQQSVELQKQNKALVAELDALQHNKIARTMQLEQVTTHNICVLGKPVLRKLDHMPWLTSLAILCPFILMPLSPQNCSQIITFITSSCAYLCH